MTNLDSERSEPAVSIGKEFLGKVLSLGDLGSVIQLKSKTEGYLADAEIPDQKLPL